MCCRACLGYEPCQTQSELRDDCCPKCRYFEDCMENSNEEETRLRSNPVVRRYHKSKK